MLPGANSGDGVQGGVRVRARALLACRWDAEAGDAGEETSSLRGEGTYFSSASSERGTNGLPVSTLSRQGLTGDAVFLEAFVGFLSRRRYFLCVIIQINKSISERYIIFFHYRSYFLFFFW